MLGIIAPMLLLFDRTDPTRSGDSGGEVNVREMYTRPRPRPTGRPWVEICMIASVDGSTVIDHTSGALSSPVDQEVLLTLRGMADVILVGAGTVRAEGYGPPRTPGQRIGVVTNRGTVDLSSALFRSGRAFVIMPEDGPELDVETLRCGRSEVDLGAAVARLDADIVQCEGGPTLNAGIAAAGLVDELNLTISPRLAGGDAPRLLAGGPDLDHRLQLAQVACAGDHLFTRWLRA
jgi:riboflavin biosynthesis pyrimidine reductase